MNYLPEILGCSYPVKYRDYIINVVYQLKRIYFVSQIYTKTLINNDVILCTKISLKIQHQQSSCDIPIHILFGTSFPLSPPEIYIETNPNVDINLKCNEINNVNMKINVLSLANWSIKTNIVEVMTDIVKAFLRNFPFIKKRAISNDKDLDQGIKQISISRVNIQDQHIPIQAQNSNNSDKRSDQKYPDNKSYSSNSLNFKPVMINSPEKNMKNIKEQTNINESTIKSFLVQEIINKIEGKVRYEMNLCKSQEQKLKSLRNDILSEMKHYRESLDKKDLFLVNYKNAILSLNDKLNSLKYKSIKDENNKSSEILDVLDDMVEMTDQKIIKNISIEMYNDEIIALFKKMVEKNILGFEESKRLVRNISRELYKLKFYQEKLIQQKFLSK